jgi:hypothetical protein
MSCLDFKKGFKRKMNGEEEEKTSGVSARLTLFLARITGRG